jgi:hypothetical protein
MVKGCGNIPFKRQNPKDKYKNEKTKTPKITFI